MIEPMRFVILILILVGGIVGCLQTENTSSLDADQYSGVVSEEFAVARKIFKQSCANGCHAYHAMSETQLIAAGVLVPGSPEASQIYYRLDGSSGSLGPKDMPQEGAFLSTEEIESIEEWVNSVN